MSLSQFKYEIKTLEISKENISQFKSIETARALRRSQVERLEKAFLDGSYIEATPLHINLKNGEYRVIDGNHRIAALVNLFEKNKANKFTIIAMIYFNLSNPKEKDLYDLIAKSVAQTTNDFLSLHRNEFPIWETIQAKSFPCKVTVYGGKDSLQLKTIMYLIRCTRVKRLTTGSSFLNRENLLATGRNTSMEDYNNLARFIRIFMSAYWAPGESNKYTRLNIIVPLFHIWYYNKGIGSSIGTIKDDIKWVKNFEIIMSDPEIVLYLNSTMNRELLPKIRSRMIDLMQPQKSKRTINRIY